MSTLDRHTENLIPITRSGWDGDIEMLTFYDVEFTEDWGPWKKGDKLDHINIDLESQVVQTNDDEGNKLTEVKFKLVPQS